MILFFCLGMLGRDQCSLLKNTSFCPCLVCHTLFVPIEWNETIFYAVATVFHLIMFAVHDLCIERARLFLTYEQNKINTNALTIVNHTLIEQRNEKRI